MPASGNEHCALYVHGGQVGQLHAPWQSLLEANEPFNLDGEADISFLPLSLLLRQRQCADLSLGTQLTDLNRISSGHNTISFK